MALLVANTSALRKARLWTMETSVNDEGEGVSMATWRYWDDTGLAIARYLDWKHGPLGDGADPGPLIERYHALLERTTRATEIKPHQFWRTVPERPFLRARRPYAMPGLEDGGRARLVAAGFALLGGISPYLVLWVGVLAALPILMWTALELAAAGRAPAALVFMLLLALSPYFVESLSLPHSAVAFYLIAALMLLALSSYVFLRPRLTMAGLSIRGAVAALVFAACVISRSGAIFLFPALVLVLGAGWHRLQAQPTYHLERTVARTALGAAALGLGFILPYLLLRPAQYHNAWMAVWQGLADFGQDRGYSWHDRDLKRIMAGHGLSSFTHPRYVDQEMERFCRDWVLADLRRKPVWYASVLGRRVMETIGLRRLQPWRPVDGRSFEKPDFHYKYTRTIEWFGFGESRLELPVSMLAAPSVVLAVLWLRARRRGQGPPQAMEPEGKILLSLALGTLTLPVLLTTAAGIETEAFALTYFLGFAFLVDHGVRWLVPAIASNLRRVRAAAHD